MAQIEKTITIECCSSNAFLDDMKRIDWLSKTYPEVSIEPDECLDRCGICMKYAYVVINGDFLYANTTSELHDRIIQYIESHRAGRREAQQILDQNQASE